jgi:DNA-binding MarR family transcriptional regulator
MIDVVSVVLTGRGNANHVGKGALVDQLERSGHLLRTVDPTDGRARLISLSEKGLAISRSAAIAAARVEHKWREHLGDKAFDQMRDGLVALREITDPYL